MLRLYFLSVQVSRLTEELADLVSQRLKSVIAYCTMSIIHNNIIMLYM